MIYAAEILLLGGFPQITDTGFLCISGLIPEQAVSVIFRRFPGENQSNCKSCKVL